MSCDCPDAPERTIPAASDAFREAANAAQYRPMTDREWVEWAAQRAQQRYEEGFEDGRTAAGSGAAKPIPMLLWCPKCSEKHVDEGAFATTPHSTHACQYCGLLWKPALGPTVGVDFLPGTRDGF